VKLIDVRNTGQELQTFHHAEFWIDLSYASCAISPDGNHAAAGSANGDVFIWRTRDGNLEQHLKGHHASGVVAVAWERGGSNGQQFASVDMKGNLLLWA
jgi:autophagy-related protein 16-1